jgi:hypothetical protein
MCCILTVLLLAGPRLAILVWWLTQPLRWQAAFTSFIWPLLGAIFLPVTTLVYVLLFPGGIFGLDWLWLTLGIIADLTSYGGSGYGNRDRIPGYSG